MARELRWGILGTGRICQDFVTALRYTRKPARVVAVGSRSLQKAARFAEANAEKNDGADVRCYGSYDELVQDERVDVIYVGTPNTEHVIHTLKALQHHKPVVCEKTFALSADSADKAIAVAVKHRLFLMEANWMPFWPLVAKALELLRAGAIGEPQMLLAGLGFANDHESNPGLLSADVGGGSLLACGIYLVSLSHMVFNGVPTSIAAQGTLAETGVDLTTAALLQYGAGRQAVLTTSIDNSIPCDATIFGTKGSLTLHAMFVCPLKLTVKTAGCEQVFEDTPPGDASAHYNFPNSAGLAHEADHVAQCLQEGLLESPVVPHSHTLECARTLDEIARQIGLELPSDGRHKKRKLHDAQASEPEA
eukprot:TRINITY_DN60970_c0_g1_i1.p1 TRINITY_DN60970_c0_g1~~TRINITY_DN60970_c0_g1_i1.p1  ORF type:complete len:364 (-),score=45.90 TRINITY_DN60970_c0_g1_i1:274-1365(-)